MHKYFFVSSTPAKLAADIVVADARGDKHRARVIQAPLPNGDIIVELVECKETPLRRVWAATVEKAPVGKKEKDPVPTKNPPSAAGDAAES